MHKHGCPKICPDVKSRSVFFFFFLQNPIFRNVIRILTRTLPLMRHQEIATAWFTLSRYCSFFFFSRAALLQTGISYLECRANIKRITATLPAIRANENFADGRPAMCVRLGDFLKHALFGGPVLGEHRFHQHRHLSSCVRGAGTLGLGWTLRRRWLVR